MNAKKIIIVTYYWPPSGGSGVQRWLKFVKYLAAQGWSPVVVTPENPSFTIKDASLLKDVPVSAEVIRLPIWEPYGIFFWLSSIFGKKNIQATDLISTKKKSGFGKISTWIRGNLFIPDARIFWVRPTVRFLESYIKKHSVDGVITTGPPHSMHIIGLRLKRKFSHLTWVADFRDPWTEWDLLDTLSLSKRAREKHQKLEHAVLTEADHVVTIAPYHVDRLEQIGGRSVSLLTNGFDEDDFRGIERKRTSKFTICHTGVVDELRDPRPFMEALFLAGKENPEFFQEVSVKFIGQVNSAFRNYVESNSTLAGCTEFISHLPHAEFLRQFGSTDLQLLVLAHTAIAPGNLPGKFFEYLASGNPIVAVGPVKGDAADVLQKTNAGRIFERSDVNGMSMYLLSLHDQWKNGIVNSIGDVSIFTRANLTRQLINILQSPSTASSNKKA